MAEQLNRKLVAQKATVHAHPPLERAPTIVDRSFELPTALYGITVALFLGYIALMGWGFAHPEMILPLAIFGLFIVAGFGIPTIWVRLNPDSGQRAKSWSRFLQDGIVTATGHSSARNATVQVLILPVLIFLWGVAVVTIAALVR